MILCSRISRILDGAIGEPLEKLLIEKLFTGKVQSAAEYRLYSTFKQSRERATRVRLRESINGEGFA